MNPTDYINTEFLKQQLTAFLGAWPVMLPTIVGTGWIGWWLSGLRYDRRITGLEGQIGVLEKQLKADTSLFEQRLALSEEARAASSTINVEMDMLKKRFDILEAALAKSDYLSLSKSVPEIRNAIGKVDAANNTLNSTLSARITEASDIASGVITVENAGALRDLDSFGPFRKAGYDTVNRIKNIGKPPGTTLTSIPKEVKRWINGDK